MYARPIRLFLFAVLLASFAFASQPTPPAYAATFAVTKTGDSNDGACNADCSLREAITAANASAGADTINLPAGTYTLTIAGTREESNATGDLDITDDLTISGQGTDASATIVQAGTNSTNGIDRVFDVISNGASVTVTFDNMTIRYGRTSGGFLPDVFNIGAGIAARASPATHSSTINITDSIINSNEATDAGGGGIFMQKSLGASTDPILNVTDSIISGNTAFRGGGGIYCEGCDTTLTRVQLINNTASVDSGFGYGGGGIANTGSSASLTISGSRIVGNAVGAGGTGSGVHVRTSTSNTLENNWWGCNGGPGAAGCDTIGTSDSATEDHTPWLVLDHSTASTTIGGSATTTATITRNNDANYTDGNPTTVPTAYTSSALNGLTTTFSTVAGTGSGNYTNGSGTIGSGQATDTLNCTTAGTLTANATLDNQTTGMGLTCLATFTLTVAGAGTGNSGVMTDTVPGSTISCTYTSGVGTSGDCTETAGGGTNFSIPANPAADSYWVSWAGCSSVVGNTCNVTLSASTTVTATYTLIADPGISKAFAPGTIGVGTANTSTLTFTLNNPNPAGVTLTGLNFTDTLPAGVEVAPAPNLGGTCNGGPVAGDFNNSDPDNQLSAGDTTINLEAAAGYTLAGGASCTISVDVTATTTGAKNNVSGNIGSAETGAGSDNATASLTVLSQPAIGKVFVPASMVMGGTSTLTFTLSNLNAGTPLTGLNFTDALPAGVEVAPVPNLGGTCNGGPVAGDFNNSDPDNQLSAGDTTINLEAAAGYTLAGGASCTISVDVTAAASGSYINTSGVLSASETGAGTDTTTATLTVGALPPAKKEAKITDGGPVALDPALSKEGSPLSATVGEQVLWTIWVSNPHSDPIDAIFVNDPLPDIFDIVEVTSTQGVVTVDGQVVTVDIGVLDPGQIVTIQIVTIANDLAAEAQSCNIAYAGTVQAKACINLFPAELPPTGGVPARLASPWGGALIGGVLLGAALGWAWLRGHRRE